MVTLQKWNSPNATTPALTSAHNDGTIAGGMTSAGNIIDNGTATALHLYAAISANINFTSAPVAADYLSIYLLKRIDSTNYDAGSSVLTPAANNLWCTLPLVTTTTGNQRLSQAGLLIPPCPFKLIMKNNTTQGLGAANVVDIVLYEEQST